MEMEGIKEIQEIQELIREVINNNTRPKGLL